ncbi:MAG: hypothetical protein ACK5XB_00825 [Rhodospirillales bacterium]|jgi:hypothetical protein
MESFFDWLYLAIGFAVGSLGFAILKDARGAGDGGFGLVLLVAGILVGIHGLRGLL